MKVIVYKHDHFLASTAVGVFCLALLFVVGVAKEKTTKGLVSYKHKSPSAKREKSSPSRS